MTFRIHLIFTLGVLLLFISSPTRVPAQECSIFAEGLDMLDVVTRDEINIEDEINIDEILASVDITHPTSGDLAIFLTSPSETTVGLYLHGGGLDADLLVNFSDSGIPHADDAFTCDCDMQPSGPGVLSDFRYEQSNGNWALDILDITELESGILNQWCLDITGCDLQPPTDLQVTYGNGEAELTWVNNDPDSLYTGVSIFVDDAIEEELAADRQSWTHRSNSLDYDEIRVAVENGSCVTSAPPLYVQSEADLQVCTDQPQNLEPSDPDGPTTHEFVLEAPDGDAEFKLERVDVRVDLFVLQTELWTLELESPLGTNVLLFDDTLEPALGPFDLIFSDQGAELAPPYNCVPCTMQPVGNLSDFAGELSGGDWLFRALSQDLGRLGRACITMFEECQTEAPTDITVTVNDNLIELEWLNAEDYDFLVLEILALDTPNPTPWVRDLDPYLGEWSMYGDRPGRLQFQFIAGVEGESCASRSEPVVVNLIGQERGSDLYRTESWKYNFGDVDVVEIPDGFFGPGSSAFNGEVDLEGNPIGPQGPFELGDVDTILRRLGSNVFDELEIPGFDESHVPIQIEKLDLKSIDPIEVVVNGQDTLWDVRVTIDELVPNPDVKPLLTFTRDDDTSGTFDIGFEVKPRFWFSSQQFIRLDANLDFLVDIADAIAILEIVFLDGESECLDAADANDDGVLDLEDFFAAVDYMFRGGDAPTAPFPAAGTDGTNDDLDCRRERSLAVEEVMLTGSGDWNADGDCSGEDLRVLGLPMGFCMDNLELTGTGVVAILVSPVAASDIPDTSIDSSALVDDEVGSIGRGATIGADAIIGPGVVVGPGAVIGAGVELTRDVIVGANSIIGVGSLLSAGSVVGGNVTVGENCSIGEHATIVATSEIADDVVIGARIYVGAACTIGDRATIGDDSRIGSRCSIGADTVIENGVAMKNDVTIGEGSLVAEDIIVASDFILGDDAELLEHVRRCTVELEDGTTVGTAEDCENAGGAVIGDVEQSPIRTPGEIKSETKIKETELTGELAQLLADAARAGDTDTTDPIKDRKYVTDTYDCDDFAHDLERALQDDGDDRDGEPDDYDSTFTVYWRYHQTSVYDWFNERWTVIWENYEAHAVTDIHTADGILFIEPQTGEYLDLDFDKDGKVTYADNHRGDFTEGTSRIEVYPDRAAAIRAGVVLD